MTELDLFLDRLLEGLKRGAFQGATANFGDELTGDAESFNRAREENPWAYAAGEFGGAFAPAFAGAGLAKAVGGGMGARGRLLTALLFGAGHGALAGAGGYQAGDMSPEDRLRDAATGGLIGGALGGLGVPATRGVRDLGDNLPALLGRVRSAEGGTTQALPFTGTRGSAPLNVSLTGSADDALRMAMRIDEGEAAALSGGGAFGRFQPGGANGVSSETIPIQAFDRDALAPLASRAVPQPGRTTASLLDYALDTPTGRGQLLREADDLELSSLAAEVKRQKPRPIRTGAPRSTTREQLSDVRSVAKFFDRPEYTDAFLGAAKKMTPAQRNKLAREIIKDLKAKVAETTPEGASALRRYLRRPDIEQKLAAITQRVRGKKPDSAAQVEALRKRAQGAGPEPAYASDTRGFRNVEDRLLARAGRLNDRDAQALLAASRRGVPMRYIEPGLPTDRLLTGAYERGVRMSPRNWFAPAEIGDLMGSVKFAQPVAASVPTLVEALSAERPTRRRAREELELIAGL